jgi:glycosyltransferase involved in cell wall biosynthesis
MRAPAISVILPFYRNPLVREAVDSILSQTFQDFELIALDDCSGNGVAELLAHIQDPRLRLVRRERNGGENATRNHGIELARGRYIAFQDHDDVSYPTRLETQFRFLEAQPAILGCGTACHYGETKVVHATPVDSRQLRWEMIFNNHVMFPTVMTRSEVARRHPFGDMVATDDYRWLFEVMAEGDFVNLPEIVFHYRMQPTSLSRERAEIQLANLDICRARFARDSGVECDEREIQLLRWLGTPRGETWPSIADLDAASDLLDRLVRAFLARHPGDDAPVRNSALDRMRYATTVSASHGLRAFRAYHRLRKASGENPDAAEVKLLAKCLLGRAGLVPGRKRG